MFALLRLPQNAEVRFDGEFHLLGAARVSEACLSASSGQRAGPLSRGQPCLRAGQGPALPGASLRSGCRRLLDPSPGELWGVWSPAAAGDHRSAPSEPGSQRRPTRGAGSEHRGTRRAGRMAWAEQVVTATE